MRNVTLEELLEAGCHFGHQVTRHNPKSRDFVFEARDNIHIIDLAKTKEGLDAAGEYVINLAKSGGTLIVVGAKRQAQAIVLAEVKRARVAGVQGIYSVTHRWMGGTLTNFGEINKNIKKLQDLQEKVTDPEVKTQYTKREIGLWEREIQKLQTFYGGIADMVEMPKALFIVDTHLEDLAVREATKTGVTTVGIVDTNSDPSIIDYPIPANDDAVGSIQLITSFIVDCFIEGRQSQDSKVEKVAKVEEVGRPVSDKGEVESALESKPKTKPKRAAKTKTKTKPAKNVV